MQTFQESFRLVYSASIVAKVAAAVQLYPSPKKQQGTEFPIIYIPLHSSEIQLT